MQEWWTPAEIAASGLPDLPASKRAANKLAEREGWQAASGRARRRAGRGGGWEYHYSLFPTRAQAALMAADATPGGDDRPGRDEAWAAFEQLPARAQQKARAKLEALDAVQTLIEAGHGKNDAAAIVARLHGCSARSIWSWMALIDGVRRDDRLAYLAPRHRTAARKVGMAECSPEAWDAFKADYLRLSEPSFTGCYERIGRLAREKGWTLPPERTLRRRVEREIDPLTLVLARKGVEALKRRYPPQVRSKHDLHALECVNADGHRFDVMVRWEDGTVGRPIMVAFQDVHSGRLLSWRIDRTENRIAVLLALGDLVETYGIPDHCVLDNGRNFASKWLTGGIPNRYRFKVKADEPLGVLPQLGVQVHWTIPYSGRSKPIERMFRDLCDRVAKHPRFEGAYTGNRPDAKPENYGSHAVPIDEFMEVLGEELVHHNTRQGRRSTICAGRSLAETFDESYAAAPIRLATPEQRRLWLMGVERLTCRGENGLLHFQDNVYWANFLPGLSGKAVAARFDPANLHDGLHVYHLDGRYVGHAPCVEKVGFLAMEEAQRHQRAMRQFLRAQRDELEATRTMTVIELNRALAGTDGAEETPPPERRVVRPAFGGRAVAAAVAREAPDLDRDAQWAASIAGVHRLYGERED